MAALVEPFREDAILINIETTQNQNSIRWNANTAFVSQTKRQTYSKQEMFIYLFVKLENKTKPPHCLYKDEQKWNRMASTFISIVMPSAMNWASRDMKAAFVLNPDVILSSRYATCAHNKCSWMCERLNISYSCDIFVFYVIRFHFINILKECGHLNWIVVFAYWTCLLRCHWICQFCLF